MVLLASETVAEWRKEGKDEMRKNGEKREQKFF